MLNKVVVLFSGGVESTTLLYMYLREGYVVYPLYIRSGYPWERLELLNARKIWSFTKEKYPNLMPMKVLSGIKTPIKSGSRDVWSIFIPLRNLLLISTASSHALLKGVDKISIGSLGLYPFPDNNSEYIKRLEELINTGSKRRIRILTPFMGIEKSEIVRKYKNLVPYHLTLSCSNPRISGGRVRPCGNCIKCTEREEALYNL